MTKETSREFWRGMGTCYDDPRELPDVLERIMNEVLHDVGLEVRIGLANLIGNQHRHSVHVRFYRDQGDE